MLFPSTFGERWENGIDIEHGVQNVSYWKAKIHKEISIALSLRDKKSISQLIRESVLFRNPERETYITSKSMMMIVTGISVDFSDDAQLAAICLEFLRKLPSHRKTLEYKSILNEVLNSPSHSSELTLLIDSVAQRTDKNELVIESQTELSIAKDLMMGPNQLIPILRADPCADVDILSIVCNLSGKDWRILVNRIDGMPRDLPSWGALSAFLSTADQRTIKKVSSYVGGYWNEYFVEMDLPDDVCMAKDSVFSQLSL